MESFLLFEGREDDAFLLSILQRPEDDTPFSMYADYLMERGNPIGSYLSLLLEYEYENEKSRKGIIKKLVEIHKSEEVMRAFRDFRMTRTRDVVMVNLMGRVYGFSLNDKKYFGGGTHDDSDKLPPALVPLFVVCVFLERRPELAEQVGRAVRRAKISPEQHNAVGGEQPVRVGEIDRFFRLTLGDLVLEFDRGGTPTFVCSGGECASRTRHREPQVSGEEFIDRLEKATRPVQGNLSNVFRRDISGNYYFVYLGELIMWFSYETLIAFYHPAHQQPSGTAYVVDWQTTDWSRTTARHISAATNNIQAATRHVQTLPVQSFYSLFDHQVARLFS